LNADCKSGNSLSNVSFWRQFREIRLLISSAFLEVARKSIVHVF
jgi:hypothetical protein